MRTIKTNVYKFDELTEVAQNKALDNNRYDNVEHTEWHDCTIDDFKEIAATIGIDIDNIYFSGFSSQGDGASFTGSYEYKKGALAHVKKEYPQYTVLHDIAQGLQELQKSNCYELAATVKHSGQYSHEYCTSMDITQGGLYVVIADVQDELIKLLRDFMREIYSTLEKEYNYLTSDEAIKESLISNECEFTSNGASI